jgi:hypothetical protein
MCIGQATLPKLTVLGKVPYPTPIQNKENGRSYPATPNIILGKVGKSGLTRTRTCALVYRMFSRRNIFARKVNPQFPNGIVSCVSFVSTTNTARNLAGFV